MSEKEELLKRLSDGVVEMEEDDVEEAARISGGRVSCI